MEFYYEIKDGKRILRTEFYYEIKDGKIVIEDSYPDSEILNAYFQKITIKDTSDEELDCLMYSLTKFFGIIKKTSQIGVELIVLEPFFIPEDKNGTSLMFAFRGEKDTLEAFRNLYFGLYMCAESDVCEITESSETECNLPILVFKKELLADNYIDVDNALYNKWIYAIKEVEEVLARL